MDNYNQYLGQLRMNSLSYGKEYNEIYYVLKNCVEEYPTDIAPSLLEINQDNNEAPYGRVERYRTCCTKLNVRKFYDYGQGDFKYQIGSENCVCECSCGCECSCTGCCECYKIQRFKFKTIKNQEGAECGEFDYVYEPTCLGFCHTNSYEIKFPNDATVSMKLLLLGGLFEAILLPYVSVPYPRRIKNY